MNVIITGASRGIGYNLVKKFLTKQNHFDNVFALTRNIKELTKIESVNFTPIECDINNASQVDEAISMISKKCISVDYLINNAGQLVNKPFLDISSREIDAILGTNFKAPFCLIQKLVPLLSKSSQSHIVNISSMGGFQGSTKFSGLSIYSSSKAALSCLTECLAVELQSTSIRINALCIGAVETEMLSNAFPNFKAPISASQMAEFIYNFTTSNHYFMNGKVIPVSLSTP